MNTRHTIMAIDDLLNDITDHLDLDNNAYHRFILNILECAICGQLTSEQKKQFIEDIINRGLIAKPNY